MSTRPTPCAPPSSFSVVSSSTGPCATPSIATGTPCSKSIVTYAGSSGAASGATVSMNMSSSRLGPGVLQDAALVAHVPDVAVAAVDRLVAVRHGHVVRRGVGQRILARADVPLAPGGDDLAAGG